MQCSVAFLQNKICTHKWLKFQWIHRFFFLTLSLSFFPFLLFLRGEWTRAKCKNEPYSSLMLTHINIEAELFFISMIFNDGKWGISQFPTAAYSSDLCVLFITWICAFCRTYMFHMQMHSGDASWKRFKYIRLFPFFLSLQPFFSFIFDSIFIWIFGKLWCWHGISQLHFTKI